MDDEVFRMDDAMMRWIERQMIKAAIMDEPHRTDSSIAEEHGVTAKVVNGIRGQLFKERRDAARFSPDRKAKARA